MSIVIRDGRGAVFHAPNIARRLIIRQPPPPQIARSDTWLFQCLRPLNPIFTRKATDLHLSDIHNQQYSPTRTDPVQKREDFGQTPHSVELAPTSTWLAARYRGAGSHSYTVV